MQFELRKALRSQSHQPGVMRPRADFREPDLIAFDEEFNAKNAASAEGCGDLSGDVAGTLQRQWRHLLRLPGFNVIPRHLHMPDRFAEKGFHAAGGAQCAYRQLRNLVVKIDKGLDDHASLVNAS